MRRIGMRISGLIAAAEGQGGEVRVSDL